MDRDSQSEDTLSTMVLENIKNRLIHAFRAAGEPKEAPQESGFKSRSMSIGRCYQANEELRRAQIDGALTWLRSELVSLTMVLLVRSSKQVSILYIILFGRYQHPFLCASVSTYSIVFLLICSWRCAHKTSSWLRHCWGLTQRSKN